MRRSLKERLKNFLALPFGHSYANHPPDYIFLAATAVLIVLGLMMLSSASSVAAYQKFSDSYYFFKQQLLKGFLPGLVLFFIISQLDYKRWKIWAWWMFIFSLGLLVLVFLPGLGATYRGVHSWINLGIISFQPTEIVKLTFLIYLATWLEKKGEHGLKNVQYGFLPFIFSLGLVVFLVMAQPDLGSLLIILAMSFSVYFIAKAPYKHILGLFLGGLIILLISLQVAPYRLARLTSFLNPEADPQGIGYHIAQAKIAVGSGGLIGLGIGKSRQKFNYLPEVYGDSIFAVIAEEMGFIFCLILIGLFLVLIIRGFKIARAAPDQFGRLLACGITSWFGFQALINIATMVGLFPLTGIPLPFISYGGTAMTVSLMAVGILVNISKQTRLS